MAIDSDLNKFLCLIILHDAYKEAIAKGLPTIKDLEDLFSEMADNRVKVEITLRLVVDMDIVSYTYILCTMFVLTGLFTKLWTPNLPGSALLVEHISVTSTINFSTNVLTADAKQKKHQSRPERWPPSRLWKSSFASVTRNSSNIRQLHNTDIVLASSSPTDVLEFHRKLVASSKPAKIDLIPIEAFDKAYALWPHNNCADVIFEMNDALALRLDQTGTLNLVDEI
jgi:hypothetical protein